MLNKRGWASKLREAIRQQQFTLILSESLYLEYVDVFFRPKFQRYGLPSEEIAGFLALIRLVAVRVRPVVRLPIAVRDSGDDHVLATALNDSVEFLITDDRDLLTLRDETAIQPLRIVTLEEFLDVLGLLR